MTNQFKEHIDQYYTRRNESFQSRTSKLRLVSSLKSLP